MKQPDGSAMGTEQYIKHVLEADSQLGLMELAALARVMGEVNGSMNIQIWTPSW